MPTPSSRSHRRPAGARVLVLTLIASALTAADGARPHLVNDGIALEAGGCGQVVLGWPQLVGADPGNGSKPSTVQVQGATARLGYGGGTTAVVRIVGESVRIAFAQVVAPTEGYRMDLILPSSLGRGGTWTIGGTDGVFPEAKPEKPFLHQGDGAEFRFAPASGGGLAIRLPVSGYQQLQDNREWNWAVYAWWFRAPLSTGSPGEQVIAFPSPARPKPR